MKKIMLFALAGVLGIAASVVSTTSVKASESATCPSANCNGGNYKCCSNNTGSTWYLR